MGKKRLYTFISDQRHSGGYLVRTKLNTLPTIGMSDSGTENKPSAAWLWHKYSAAPNNLNSSVSEVTLYGKDS
jgi:hypothetical protein